VAGNIGLAACAIYRDIDAWLGCFGELRETEARPDLDERF